MPMGKRSSHGAVVRLAETGFNRAVEKWPLAAGSDAGREQGYLRRVRPQSDGQRELMEAIQRYHLIIALGPAGTGKTYLAVSAAVGAFEAGAVGRIALTRGWVVERTFSWFGRNRRLAKDFENLVETVATFVTVASIQLAPGRLARA